MNTSIGKDIHIRLAYKQDIPHILTIRRKTFLHFAPAVYSEKEVATLLDDVKESEFEKMIDNKNLFVAEKENKIVGCGGWLDESVRHMYVAPEQTKQGIGSALLQALEKDYLKRTNKSIIKAGVILYARGFYEKNGYTFLKLDTAWDGTTFNRMEKRLV